MLANEGRMSFVSLFPSDPSTYADDKRSETKDCTSPVANLNAMALLRPNCENVDLQIHADLRFNILEWVLAAKLSV